MTPNRIRLAVVTSALAVGVSTALAAATWSTVTTPNVGTGPNALNGVAALSPTSAWAVGHSYNSATAVYRTLVERWNGTAWNVVASPNGSSAYNELWDVAALSPSSAWAVGYSNPNGGGASNALIERWNGTSWTIVPTGAAGTLFGVAASSGSDVWAVGGPLTMHFNGQTWAVVPAQPPPGGGFYAVATLGTSNAWAVGNYPVTSHPRTDKTLVEHWNGTSWTAVPSPNAAGSATNVLHGVAALGPADIWAVGWYYPTGSLVTETLIEHWNGSSWQVVPSPNGPGQSVLWDVTALSPTDVWAAGYANTSNGLHTLVEHWDGHSWTVNPSPNPGLNPRLQAIASATPATVWAVGITDNSTTNRTLALRTTQG
jgi:hypothetical protein